MLCCVQGQIRLMMQEQRPGALHTCWFSFVFTVSIVMVSILFLTIKVPLSTFIIIIIIIISTWIFTSPPA